MKGRRLSRTFQKPRGTWVTEGRPRRTYRVAVTAGSACTRAAGVVGARERGPQSSQEEKKEGWEPVKGPGRSPPCCPTHLDSQRPSHLLPGAVGHRPSPGQVLSPVNWATCTGSGVCGLSRTPCTPARPTRVPSAITFLSLHPSYWPRRHHSLPAPPSSPQDCLHPCPYLPEQSIGFPAFFHPKV